MTKRFSDIINEALGDLDKARERAKNEQPVDFDLAASLMSDLIKTARLGAAEHLCALIKRGVYDGESTKEGINAACHETALTLLYSAAVIYLVDNNLGLDPTTIDAKLDQIREHMKTLYMLNYAERVRAKER